MLFQPFQVKLVALVYGAVGGEGTLAAGCSGEYGSGRSGRRKRGGGLQHDEQRSAGKIKLWRSAVLPGAVMMSSIAVISVMLTDDYVTRGLQGCFGAWTPWSREQ